MKEIFRYDDLFFKKRLLQRMGIIGLIYLSFLFTNYLGVPSENKIEFLKIFLPISALLAFFFYRNFKKQLKIVREGQIELEGKTLRQFSGAGECLELDLNDVKAISKDNFKSYSRILVGTVDREYSFLNLAEMGKFEDNLKSATNLPVIEVKFELRDILKKAVSYFVPSIVCAFLVFYPKTNLDIRILYLAININAIFFVRSLTEHKSASTIITDNLIRRTIFILFITMLAQIIFFAFC